MHAPVPASDVDVVGGVGVLGRVLGERLEARDEHVARDLARAREHVAEVVALQVQHQHPAAHDTTTVYRGVQKLTAYM